LASSSLTTRARWAPPRTTQTERVPPPVEYFFPPVTTRGAPVTLGFITHPQQVHQRHFAVTVHFDGRCRSSYWPSFVPSPSVVRAPRQFSSRDDSWQGTSLGWDAKVRERCDTCRGGPCSSLWFDVVGRVLVNIVVAVVGIH